MLLGADNISSLSPQQLGSRFMLSQLNHKAANICADLREIDRIEEGTLKAVVSGDLVYADQKYREGVNFRPRTRLWFSTNVLPRLADTSIGIWRRMQLIPFDYIVPVESVDIHLIDTLRKELPAVFLWTIKGLIRLRANKGFTRSECCTNAKHRYRLTCFPVMTFIEECCTADPLPTGQPAQATVAVLWGAYRAWCHASGLTKPKPLHTFSNDLLAFTPRIQYVAARRTSRAATVLHGIRLRTDYHPDPGQAVTPAQYGLAY